MSFCARLSRSYGERRKANLGDMPSSGWPRDTLRLLGLDVGDRRIGVAISDPTGSLASPVEVYHRRDQATDTPDVHGSNPFHLAFAAGELLQVVSPTRTR